MFLMWIVLLIIFAVLTYLYFRFFKIPRLKSVVFVDGAPGAGKSNYTVHLSIKFYKKALRRYKFRKVFLTLMSPFGKNYKEALSRLEEPMLYSNIPLGNVKHCPLVLDVVLRKVRIPDHSIILWDETSIAVDQFDYKDRAVSDALRDFMKLSRHQFDGKIFLNSQTTNDLHYAVKSVLTEYFYIHHSTRIGPFTLFSLQELAYSADSSAGSVVNAFNSDIEDSMKRVLVWTGFQRHYNHRCYRELTDGLPLYDSWVVLSAKDPLTTKKVFTFKKGRYEIK